MTSVASACGPAVARLSRWFLLVLLAFCSTVPTLGGIITSYEDARALPEAAVNTAVKQFSYAGAPEKQLSARAERLSLLIQLDALFSQVKFGSIAVQFMNITPQMAERYSSSEFIDRFSRSCKDRHGIVLMEGSLFESGTDIFVQTEIRFWRKKTIDAITCTVPIGEGIAADLQCRMPTDVVSFAPRRFSDQDLAQVDELFQQNAVIRTAPDLNAPGIQMQPFSLKHFAFSVEEIRGEWMKILSWGDGYSGWVKADLSDELRGLRKIMPELDFLEATAGYLRYRVAADLGQPPARRWKDAVNKAAARFAERVDLAEDGVPLALLSAMSGSLDILESNGKRELMTSGFDQKFRQVAELMPFSADARGFAAVADFYHCCSKWRTDSTAVLSAAGLESVVRLDPGNLAGLHSLKSIYAAWAKMPSIKASELDSLGVFTRLEEVNAALKQTKDQ